MINIIRSHQRYFSDFGWLKTYWLFSFSRYYDPENIQFGALRVFNDDVVEPGTGFPTHPHEEMEIVTIPMNGELTHEDSMGNKTVITAGEVQRMSAGTGLTHSEFNLGSEPCHFYQIWIYPDIRGLEPTYDQREFDRSSWRNCLFPVASGRGLSNVVTFHTNATIYRSDLDPGKNVTFESDDSRRVFVYLAEGAIRLNEESLTKNDQARVDEVGRIVIEAKEASGLILIDVPSCKGWGYDGATLKGARR